MIFIESLKAECFDYDAILAHAVFRFHRISNMDIIRDFLSFLDSSSTVRDNCALPLGYTGVY